MGDNCLQTALVNLYDLFLHSFIYINLYVDVACCGPIVSDQFQEHQESDTDSMYDDRLERIVQRIGPFIIRQRDIDSLDDENWTW